MWSDGLYDDSVADMLDELSIVREQYFSEIEAEAAAELSLIKDESYPSELDAEADSELSLIW